MCLFLYYDRWQEGTRYHDTGASWRKQENGEPAKEAEERRQAWKITAAL